MPRIRLIFLWHMHQPFYKDLVTGEYRLPWVRLHALKDYYGMVKLLDEFPDVHQTFNLVPSLIAQIQDYLTGAARDPFLDVASKPARDLTPAERRFALDYLFQANPVNMIGRYPRYRQLWEQFRATGHNAERTDRILSVQDFTDLQVLSQLAWFDEFFLQDGDIAALVRKGRGFSQDDQRFIVTRQRELLALVLPAYAAAARRGGIEISTSPFYHPILPLLVDSNLGAVSSPGLKLPQRRFIHPEDAREQLKRGLDLHERVFGVRPRGVWPSEGSVSEKVIAIAHELGVEWMATDEGVLGRSLSYHFSRDGSGRLQADGPDRLYRVYRYEQGPASMYMVFRDHMLSDLIGFVYSGMPAAEAAANFIQKIKHSAQPVLRAGRDAVVSIILDGENAWEYYPRSGREFLSRVYDAIQHDPGMEALTVSEAILAEAGAAMPLMREPVVTAMPLKAAQDAVGPSSPVSLEQAITRMTDRRRFARLSSLVPGSWINANFNVWIGAPEDNRSWDYLSSARDFYANAGITASAEQRAIAYEELLIAEGSDWNWWYGPEHHTANDRDFDELYRKHLSNVYHILGAAPPDYLAQPIAAAVVRPMFVPQTAYIRPRIGARYERYFDWIGAAMYTADRRAGAMHGKQFLLDSVYAGIDDVNLYGRLDFAGGVPQDRLDLTVTCECVKPPAAASASVAAGAIEPQSIPAAAHVLRIQVTLEHGAIANWKLEQPDSSGGSADFAEVPSGVEVALRQSFAFKLPLVLLHASAGDLLRLRFTLWRDRLPVDALPIEGWIELRVSAEEDLDAGLYNYSVSS
ncbi:MAG: hypothetical protein ACE14M_03230 [Terriglobales bacterium]